MTDDANTGSAVGCIFAAVIIICCIVILLAYAQVGG